MAIDSIDTDWAWNESLPTKKSSNRKKRNLYLTGNNINTNLRSNNLHENITTNNSDFTQVSYKEGFKSKTTSPFSTEGNINNHINNSNNAKTVKPFALILNPWQLDEKYNEIKNFNDETEKIHLWRNNYIDDNDQIDDRKRWILLDWIMEVCTMMGFKRRTYHWSVVWVDTLLSKTENLDIKNLQLIGVTCWIISAKNEEIVIPCIDKFALSTASAYSKEEILNCEKEILIKLSWKIQYPTLLDWGNYVMYKWDLFALKRKSVLFDTIELPLFRNKQSGDLYLPRNYFLIIDAISLDFYSIFISEKIVSTCIVYLLIGLSCNCFTIENILTFFSEGEWGASYYSFKYIFSEFLENVMNITQEELLNILKYVCQFFNISFDYTSPLYKGSVSNTLITNIFSHRHLKKTCKCKHITIKTLNHWHIFLITGLVLFS